MAYVSAIWTTGSANLAQAEPDEFWFADRKHRGDHLSIFLTYLSLVINRRVQQLLPLARIFTHWKVAMNDDKLALYESLIRASLILIFSVALIVGAVGFIAISQMLMRQTVANSQFVATDRSVGF